LNLIESNITCSKVNKSTRAKLAVIFAHFRFNVISFCVVAAMKIKGEFGSKTSFLFIVATTQKAITLYQK
jgi:hypothetical protein